MPPHFKTLFYLCGFFVFFLVSLFALALSFFLVVGGEGECRLPVLWIDLDLKSAFPKKKKPKARTFCVHLKKKIPHPPSKK
jgi:hypothetical protein